MVSHVITIPNVVARFVARKGIVCQIESSFFMLSVVEPNEQNLYLLLFIGNVTIKVENTLSCVAGESCDFLEIVAEAFMGS